MNIGDLARLSGVNSKMIRRYEEAGIIPKAGRSVSGYRTYSEKDIHILRFVNTSRALGFSMKDIKELLGLWKNKSRKSAQVKALANRHIEELKAKRDEIEAILKTLSHLTKNCHGDQRPECPVLDGIENSQEQIHTTSKTQFKNI